MSWIQDSDGEEAVLFEETQQWEQAHPFGENYLCEETHRFKEPHPFVASSLLDSDSFHPTPETEHSDRAYSIDDDYTIDPEFVPGCWAPPSQGEILEMCREVDHGRELGDQMPGYRQKNHKSSPSAKSDHRHDKASAITKLATTLPSEADLATQVKDLIVLTNNLSEQLAAQNKTIEQMEAEKAGAALAHSAVYARLNNLEAVTRNRDECIFSQKETLNHLEENDQARIELLHGFKASLSDHTVDLAAQVKAMQQVETEIKAFGIALTALTARVGSSVSNTADPVTHVGVQDQSIKQLKTENHALRQIITEHSHQLEALFAVQKSQQTAIAAEQDHLGTMAKLINSEAKNSTNGLVSITSRMDTVESRLDDLSSSSINEAQKITATCPDNDAGKEISTTELGNFLGQLSKSHDDLHLKQLKLDEHSSAIEDLTSAQSAADDSAKNMKKNLRNLNEHDETVAKGAALVRDRMNKSLNGLDDYKSTTGNTRSPTAPAKGAIKLATTQTMVVGPKNDKLRGELLALASKVDQVDSNRVKDRFVSEMIAGKLEQDTLELEKKVQDSQAFKASQILVNKNFHARLPGIGDTTTQDLTDKVNKLSQELQEVKSSVDTVSTDLEKTTTTVKTLAFQTYHPHPDSEATKLQQMMDSVGLKGQRINKLVTTTQDLTQAQDSSKEKLNGLSKEIDQLADEQVDATSRMNQLASDLTHLKTEVDKLTSPPIDSSIQEDEKAEADSQSVLNTSSNSVHTPPHTRKGNTGTTNQPTNMRNKSNHRSSAEMFREAQLIRKRGIEMQMRNINGSARQDDDSLI